MSVIGSFENAVIISHDAFINNVYKSVKLGDDECSYVFRNVFFNTNEPYKRLQTKQLVKKKRIELDPDAMNVLKVHENYKDVIRSCLSKMRIKDPVSDKEEESICNNESVDTFNGGNLTENCLVVAVNGSHFLIPDRCHFFNDDVRYISKHVNEKYDVIILDPPWWNKYIRRKRARNSGDAYNMMWNDELAQIPVENFLKPDSLVVVWCTNSKSHIDAIKTKIFPKWGLKFVSQWFWLKLTKEGEPITPYSPTNGKQPFERILFGCKNERNLPLPDPDKLIISVPSIIHSHKPPLCEVLQQFLPNGPKGLEIFARYLLPNFTSYGNQVLKFQHLSFYTKS